MSPLDLAYARPGEKIGIVGRTGSGKSTLMQVLFRMVDCEDGSVAIDGVDTKAIGLAALRSRLTIIPQVMILITMIISPEVFEEPRGHKTRSKMRFDGREQV